MNDLRVQNVLNTVLQRVVGLPRWVRIGLAALFSITLTLLVTPLAHSILRVDIFVPDRNMLIAPMVIALVCGIVFYFLGWYLMVGFAGEAPKPRMALVWYFGAGVVICLLALALVVQGALSGTAA